MGKYQEALTYIQKAVEIENDNSTLLDHLGDVNFKLGKKETAVELWKEALRLDSENEKIQLKIDKGEL